MVPGSNSRPIPADAATVFSLVPIHFSRRLAASQSCICQDRDTNYREETDVSDSEKLLSISDSQCRITSILPTHFSRYFSLAYASF